MADQNLHFVFPSHLCSQEKCACANEKANTSDCFLHLVQPASLERLFAHSNQELSMELALDVLLIQSPLISSSTPVTCFNKLGELSMSHQSVGFSHVVPQCGERKAVMERTAHDSGLGEMQCASTGKTQPWCSF